MECIWKYIFDELEVDLPNTNVMVSSLPLERMQDDNITQILFETFGIASIDVVLEPTLVLYSHGSTSGTVFHMGHGTSYIAPIYNGYCIRNAIQYCPIIGEDITKILASCVELKLFEGKRYINEELLYPFSSIDEMKKKVCYVTENYHAEFQTSSIKYYDLEIDIPDVKERRKYHIGLGKERFQCCEAIFNPQVCGYSGRGVHDMILESVTTYPSKYHNIFSNIYVSGGATLAHGFIKRLDKELASLNSLPFEVFASERRDIAAWVGGSVLGCLNSHYKSWWTREEYVESGNRMWSMRYDVDLGTGDLMETLQDDSMIPFLMKGPTTLELISKHIPKPKGSGDKQVAENVTSFSESTDGIKKSNSTQNVSVLSQDQQEKAEGVENNPTIESKNDGNNNEGTTEKLNDVDSPNIQRRKETKLPENCKRCNSNFYIFRRRHLCRNCNMMVCDSCSPGRQIIEGCGPKPVRVCLDCFPET